MLTLIIVLVIATAITIFLTKKGKIEDVNNNNIPDVIEKPIEAVKEVVAEVKEVAKKVTVKKKEQPAPKMDAKPKSKKPATKKPAKKDK